jgi:hypothetical protein
MDEKINPLSYEFEEWLEKQGVPSPYIGGSFAYCPHVHPEVVKEPKKRAKTIQVKCRFRTRGIRRYARHYRRRHGDQPEQAASLANADAKISESQAARKRTPKYAPGDYRRAK